MAQVNSFRWQSKFDSRLRQCDILYKELLDVGDNSVAVAYTVKKLIHKLNNSFAFPDRTQDTLKLSWVEGLIAKCPLHNAREKYDSLQVNGSFNIDKINVSPVTKLQPAYVQWKNCHKIPLLTDAHLTLFNKFTLSLYSSVDIISSSPQNQKQSLWFYGVERGFIRLLYYRAYCTGWRKKVSRKLCPYLRQILTDFQNVFTRIYCRKFVVKWLLNIPPHLNCVVVLPCEI